MWLQHRPDGGEKVAPQQKSDRLGGWMAAGRGQAKPVTIKASHHRIEPHPQPQRRSLPP
jgi:hypothetical protein